MERRPKNENELIQEGLERFLEQELKGISSNEEQGASVLPDSQNVSRKPDRGTIQMIDLDRPAGRRRGQQGFTAEDRNGLDLDFEEQVPEKNRNVPRNLNGGKSTKAARPKPGNRNTEKKTKNKKASGWKKLLIVLAVLFVIIMGGLYALVGSIYDKMEYEEVKNYSSEPMKEKGVINILLIGNDSRENGEDGRSDAMILISISDKTKTITMTSLLRDMYVDIPGHDGNRLNAAYSYGGPELLMETIEQNFDIEVHRYALVNFQAFANLVDAVGGVDLELTNGEVNYVNGYLVEYNMLEGRPEGTDYLDTSLSGMIHLNGPQALAYTRNRYIGTDFGRTERQRKVLAAVMKKMPGTLAVNSGELIDGLFPNLTTNLTKNECFRLSLDGSKFLTYELVQQAIPAEGTYSNATIRSMAVLEVDFEANKKILQESIYGK
ncbi:MAG: LCP family protein [Lachnospiraceae bacterium]|nr:LCP family protein [Lachnospiraceae bacterium]